MKTSVKFILFISLLLLSCSTGIDMKNLAEVPDKHLPEACTSFEISESTHSDALVLNGISDESYRNRMHALSLSDVELGFKLCSENYSFQNNLRNRRVIEPSDLFKNLLYGLCLRDNLLVLDKSKNYRSDKKSYIAHTGCKYYVFALRRILI